VILVIFVTMVYGPIAALLSNCSRPASATLDVAALSHRQRLVRRLLPATSFAIVASTGDIYAGLWYPVIFASITVVVGFFFLPETRIATSPDLPPGAAGNRPPLTAQTLRERPAQPCGALFVRDDDLKPARAACGGRRR